MRLHVVAVAEADVFLNDPAQVVVVVVVLYVLRVDFRCGWLPVSELFLRGGFLRWSGPGYWSAADWQRFGQMPARSTVFRLKHQFMRTFRPVSLR